MEDYKESKKEKAIRVSLIILVCIIIFAAFSYRNKKLMAPIAKEETEATAAVVLKEGTAEQNPRVVLYEEKENEHLLAVYEIQLDKHYFFKTLKAAKLRNPPESIAADRSSEGVWVKMSGKWHYLNESLEEEKRPQDYRNSSENIHFSSKKVGNKLQLMLPEGKRVWLDGREKVKQVYPLTAEENLWLVLTVEDVKIIEVFE